MKRKGIGMILCVMLFCILQLTKGSMLCFMEKHYGEGRIEIYPKEAIAFSSFYSQDSYKQLMPAVMGQEDYTICTKDSIGKGQYIDVEGMGTNAYFEVMAPFVMKEGAYFGEEAVNEGRAQVVISDTLAKVLFQSDQVIGNSCEIEGNVYQIVGVYTRYSDFRDTLFDTGVEKIYFPITSKVGQRLKISGILLPPTQGEEIVDEKALNTLGINENNSLIYAKEDMGKCLKSLAQVSMNIAGLMLFIEAILCSIYLGKHKEIEIRKKTYVLVSILVVGCIGVMMMKRIYIPSSMLPPYNIFDVTHYWKYYKAERILHNQLARIQLTDFAGTYWLISKWCWEINIVQIVVGIKLCCDIRNKIKCYKRSII